MLKSLTYLLTLFIPVFNVSTSREQKTDQLSMTSSTCQGQGCIMVTLRLRIQVNAWIHRGWDLGRCWGRVWSQGHRWGWGQGRIKSSRGLKENNRILTISQFWWVMHSTHLFTSTFKMIFCTKIDGKQLASSRYWTRFFLPEIISYKILYGNASLKLQNYQMLISNY